MINIDLAGEVYSVVNNWSDLTLKRYIEIQKICDKAPKKLKYVFDLHYNNKGDELKDLDISITEQEKTFPTFYGKIICALSDMPKKQMNRIMAEDREDMFWKYFSKFVMGALIAAVDVEPVENDSFTFELDEGDENYEECKFAFGEYRLPKSKEVMGKKRPFGYLETIQFTEASYLKINMMEFDAGDYSKLANIVSILCLKDGEEYDEDVCLERAKAFKFLTMDIVWDVFFYLYGSTIVCQIYSLQSTQEDPQ